MIPVLLLALLPACLLAQADARHRLPTLARLGPLPAQIPQIDLGQDGSLRLAGAAVAVADLAAAMPGASAVALSAPADTGAGLIGALVQRLHRIGVRKVHFVAQLAGAATIGSFALELPEGDVPTDLDLRLSFARHGVPATSVVPCLGRIVDGLPPSLRDALRIGVEVPADVSFDRLLDVLAAVELAKATRVLLRWPAPPAQPAANAADNDLAAFAASPRDTLPAIDLGPSPAVQIVARELPLARPERADGEVGLAAPLAVGLPESGGGAGGRYGGRGRAAAAHLEAGLEANRSFTCRAQRADGAWTDNEGQPDRETTALALLSLLTAGGGPTGQGAGAIARGVGSLIEAQGADGNLGGSGARSVHRHALCTYALAEAYGLSDRGPLLRGHLIAALQWLEASALPSGGWNDGTPGAPLDPTCTGDAVVAITSAQFFRLPTALDAKTMLGWLPPIPAQGNVTEGAAAVLFARLFLGGPEIGGATADWLTTTPLDDAPTCQRVTQILYQVGGAPWATWSKRLLTLPPAVVDGPFAGSCEPTGELDRVTATSLRVLTMAALQRYTRLVR